MKNLIPQHLFEMAKYDDSEVRSALEEFLYYLNDYDYDFKEEFDNIIENKYGVKPESESLFKNFFNLKNKSQTEILKSIELLMDNRGSHPLFSYQIDNIYDDYGNIIWDSSVLMVYMQYFNHLELKYYTTINNESDIKKLSIVELTNPEKLVKRIIKKMKELL
jgi:uncharacterized protein YdiU (UPF0061 family)